MQQPRVLSRPPWASSAGGEAIDLARSAGVILDPWQELEVLLILAEAANGNWAAFETAVLVARQNGKGEIILVLELAGLFLLGEMLLLHSAHEFKTSKEAYLRIKGVIEGAPHLSRLVKQFRQSNEDTSVELMSGARLRFMARSRQSGRGFSAQRLLVDESQTLPRAAMGALMPTLSAQANPQINYFGTVPDDDQPAELSEHWTDLRNRGRAGDDPFLLWSEFNIGPTCDDLDDHAAWVAANPALGYRLTDITIARERASLSNAAFAGERLSLWADDAETAPQWLVIPEAEWVACKSGEKVESDGWLEGPVTLAVEVTFDRSAATISAAGDCREGGVGVEVIESGAGTHWVVDSLVALTSDESKPVGRVVVDPGGPAASLIEPLEAAGVTVTQCKFADCKVATAGMRDAAKAKGIVHRDRPELNDAVAHAQPRTVSDAVLVDRRAGVDVSPFIAALLARWGHLQGYNTTPATLIF